MMSFKKQIIPIFTLVLWCSCAAKEESKAPATNQTGKDTSTVTNPVGTTPANEVASAKTTETPVTPVVENEKAKLVFKKLADKEDQPQCEVSLSVGTKLTKIKVINGCQEIGKSEYKRYEIPTDAINAGGGWWAGGGEYYYLILKEGKPVVYYGWQDEGQEDNGYHWKIQPVQ